MFFGMQGKTTNRMKKNMQETIFLNNFSINIALSRVKRTSFHNSKLYPI